MAGRYDLKKERARRMSQAADYRFKEEQKALTELEKNALRIAEISGIYKEEIGRDDVFNELTIAQNNIDKSYGRLQHLRNAANTRGLNFRFGPANQEIEDIKGGLYAACEEIRDVVLRDAYISRRDNTPPRKDIPLMTLKMDYIDGYITVILSEASAIPVVTVYDYNISKKKTIINSCMDGEWWEPLDPLTPRSLEEMNTIYDLGVQEIREMEKNNNHQK